jgi:methylenetetrahydrofolate reductase (NADPH)
MTPSSKLAKKLDRKEFVVTAEWRPPAATGASIIETAAKALGNGLAAVGVPDNHAGIGMSASAACSLLLNAGVEPIHHLATRDRNRIALQSDLLGACALGIRNVLCTSGRHQTLIDESGSANVYDLDSVQLVWATKQMRDEGTLLDGTPIAGEFPMLIGAVTNPYLRPLELNMIQLAKKIEAGADFIQTHPVFDVSEFAAWLAAAQREGLTSKVTIMAGVLPLTSHQEATQLRETHTDLCIPDEVVERLKAAGDGAAQEKLGVKMCAETAGMLKGMDGVRGVHILSGGRERLIADLCAAAGL